MRVLTVASESPATKLELSSRRHERFVLRGLDVGRLGNQVLDGI
jgi:hypothetical protein